MVPYSYVGHARRACAPPRGPDPDRGPGNAVPRRPAIEPVIAIVIVIVIDIVIVIVIDIVIRPVIRPAKREFETTGAAAAAGRLLPVHRACQGFSERTASATGHGHKE